MRFLFKLLMLALFGLILAIPAVVYFMIQPERLVAHASPLGARDVARARKLVKEHNPARLKDGERATAVLAEADLTLLLRYAASAVPRSAGVAKLARGRAELFYTITLPKNPIGRYINVTAELIDGARHPRVAALKIGRVPVPGVLADFALWKGVALAAQRFNVPNPIPYLEKAGFNPGELAVTYRWNAELPGALREAVVPKALQASLKAHHEQLVAYSSENTQRARIGLHELLAAQFAFARRRASEGPPEQENRAALAVLGSFMEGQPLWRLAPDAKNWPLPSKLKITLQGRKDLAQHFIVSASIAAFSNSGLSNAIGVFKEVDDSRGGTGFSFRDLAADKAGTRFGELAVSSATKARELQALVGKGLSDAALLPPVSDLPEHMQESEFKRRFESRQSQAYQAMVQRIERRIATLSLYQ